MFYSRNFEARVSSCELVSSSSRRRASGSSNPHSMQNHAKSADSGKLSHVGQNESKAAELRRLKGNALLHLPIQAEPEYTG